MTDNHRSHSDCPSTAALRQLLAGELAADKEGRLTDHISKCEDCQEAMDGLTPVELVRQARDTGRHPGQMPPALTQLLQQTLADVRESFTDTRPETDSTRADGTSADSTSADSTSADSTSADILPWLEATEDDSIGKVGPYRLTRLLGRGGMGVVFLGRDEQLNRRVAVKMLSPGLISDTTSRERFLREARAVAAILHPSIVAIHRVESGDRLPWFAMEYVAGKSLEEHLAGGRRFSAGQVIRIGYQVATALAAAHGASVIHRDIKPGNILIEDESGRVRLLDFGLARNTAGTHLTTSGTLIGTPSYMAPETIAEQPQDERTDLYGLGAVLYHLLTGAPPFQADTVVGTIYAISKGDFPPLADHTSGPPQLLQIVERLLQSDPEQRFQTAAEVAEALRNAKRGIAPADRPGPLARLPIARGWAIGAAVALVALLIVLWRPWVTTADNPPVSGDVNDKSGGQMEQSGGLTAAGSGADSATQPPATSGADDTAQPDIIQPDTSQPDSDNRAVTSGERPMIVSADPPAGQSDAAEANSPNGDPADTTNVDVPAHRAFRFCREDGSIAGQATSLEDAVRGAPDGGTVVIVTREPVVLEEPVMIGDKSLTIEADGELAEIEVRFREASPIFETEQDLRLERLKIVNDPDLREEELEDLAIVALNGGRLECRGCQFAQPDGAICWIHSRSSAEFHDCHLWVPQGAAVRCSADDAPGQVEFTECRVVCYTALLLEPALPADIQIHSSQIIGEHLLTVDVDDIEAPAQTATTCTVTDSVLCTLVGTCHVITSDTDRASLGLFSWQGAGNIRTSPLLLVSRADADDAEPTDRSDALLRQPGSESRDCFLLPIEELEQVWGDEEVLNPDSRDDNLGRFAAVMEYLQQQRLENQ